MDLIQLVLILAFIGALLYVLNKYAPIEQTIKTIINCVVLLAVILWMANIFGVLPNIHVGKR